MNSIFKRRSIRKYKDVPVTDEQIKTLLSAAMAAPTACNAQEWEFIVIKSREMKDKIMKVHPYSKALINAGAAFLVCGNQDKEIAKDYFQQDCAAAIQNILLQATEMGLGSLWMGVYPNEKVKNSLIQLFELPSHIQPVGLVAVGTADEERPMEDRYDEKKVHYEIY